MISFSLLGCTEPIAPENISFENLLVIEGLLNDLAIRQKVLVSRTSELTEDTLFNGVSGAEVWIENANGERISFIENEPGIYLTQDPFAGVIGERYQLFVNTTEASYSSDQVVLLATPEIDSLYMEFEPSPSRINNNGGFFNIFIDSRSNPDQNKHYRWTWNSTFELTLESPSRWLWTGGNSFVSRELGGENDSLQVEECWRTDNSSVIHVKELLEGTSIIREPIHSFHSDERSMRIRYSIEAKQFAISEASFDYWNALSLFSQQQGFLFDIQPGTVVGNIRNTTDPKETVLGIFEASQERTVRRFYEPSDFVDEGYLRATRNFLGCDDIEPIISVETNIAEIMEVYGETYAICCFFSTGPPNEVWFFPKSCSECTQYGDNKRPSFW